MLAANNIHMQVGDKHLLHDVSLQIKPGEVLAVLGPNGAGKSTLLKILSGEMDTTQGNVTLNDNNLSQITPKQRAKLRAVLPQDASLSFPFKVNEVVMMGRSPYRGAGIEVDTRIIEECLTAAEAVHLAQRDYTTLSGGERQRVQLARVLAQIWESDEDSQHRYLLLDEPTSALDLAHQHHTFAVARDLAVHRGIGVLAVLHDLNLAALYADRIAILKQGKMLCQGTPKEVLNPANIKQAFEIPAAVLPHPLRKDCPLIVASGITSSMEHSEVKQQVMQ